MHRNFIHSIVLVVWLAAVPAGACESLLVNSSKRRLDPVFSVAAGLDEAKIRYLLKSNMVFVVRGGSHHTWTMLFDPKTETKNWAHLVLLHETNGRYFIKSIRHAEMSEEREYFHKVAELHGLKRSVLMLKQRILNCRAVAIESWVAAKLWLKHRLRLDDVLHALEQKHFEPVLDMAHAGSERFHPRYKVEGPLSGGRRMRLILADQGQCPPPLVTAFELEESRR